MAKTANENMLLEMAYPRSVFKDKLEEYLGGAGRVLQSRMRQSQRPDEVGSPLDDGSEPTAFFHGDPGVFAPDPWLQGPAKALAEALAELMAQDAGYRNYAMNTVVKDYGLRKLKSPIPADATRRFCASVEDHVRRAERIAPLEDE